MTFEFDSKGRRIYDNTVSVKKPLGRMSEVAHLQPNPPPPFLSCLCRERLNSFDSTLKLLIWS